MEFTKQYGLGHKIQRLYIHWDITTFCEYKCSYCYAREEYKTNWNRPGNWKKQLKVIEALKRANLPIFLGLLGGEPTSHHKYFELVNIIQKDILPKHKDSRLYITTNGAKDIEFYNRHTISDDKKLYILWSWHPEYNNKTSSDLFIQKIKLMISKGYKDK